MGYTEYFQTLIKPFGFSFGSINLNPVDPMESVDNVYLSMSSLPVSAHSSLLLMVVGYLVIPSMQLL